MLDVLFASSVAVQTDLTNALPCIRNMPSFCNTEQGGAENRAPKIVRGSFMIERDFPSPTLQTKNQDAAREVSPPGNQRNGGKHKVKATDVVAERSTQKAAQTARVRLV